MFKFDVYFRNIDVRNYIYLEKVYKLRFLVMVAYTPQLKDKNNQKAATDFAECC